MKLYFLDLPRNNDDPDDGGIWRGSKAEAVSTARQLRREMPDSGNEYIGDTIAVIRVEVPCDKAGLLKFLNDRENRRTPHGVVVLTLNLPERDEDDG